MYLHDQRIQVKCHHASYSKFSRIEAFLSIECQQYEAHLVLNTTATRHSHPNHLTIDTN